MKQNSPYERIYYLLIYYLIKFKRERPLPLPFEFILLTAQPKTLVEAVNTAARVNELLLAGEVRMALRANFHADVLLGGTRVNHIAASTGDGGFLILRMNGFFHSCHLFRSNRTVSIIAYRLQKANVFPFVPIYTEKLRAFSIPYWAKKSKYFLKKNASESIFCI